MKIKSLGSLVMLSLLFSTGFAKAATPDNKVFISIDSDALKFTTKKFGSRVEEISSVDGISVLKIDEDALPWLSLLMHKNFNRCAGFMLHDDETDANNLLNSVEDKFYAKNNFFTAYKIDQDSLVAPMIEQLKAENILATIIQLSAFQNRYYKGEFGKKSAASIKDMWTNLVKNRSDASVEYFPHARWDQPSIIMTIKGQSNETIVLGGHQDSINLYGGASSRAPGSDDNASGIATITEVVRVLVDNSYQPQKTLKFMAYAAEEEGLLGSKEIAADFKNRYENVIGVMQLDMTFGKQKFIPKYMPSKTGGYQYREVEKLAEKIKWNEMFRRAYRGGLLPFRLSLCNENNRYVVIIVDGKDVGFARLANFTDQFSDLYSGEVWELADAYIKPPYRNRGIFNDFIKELIANYSVKLILLTEARYFDNEKYYADLGLNMPFEIDVGLYRIYLGEFIESVESRFGNKTLH